MLFIKKEKAKFLLHILIDSEQAGIPWASDICHQSVLDVDIAVCLSRDEIVNDSTLTKGKGSVHLPSAN